MTEIGHLGIIANVRDGGNQQDIKDVENIAKRYISRPNCLVLLVISCESKLLKNVFLKFSFRIVSCSPQRILKTKEQVVSCCKIQN